PYQATPDSPIKSNKHPKPHRRVYPEEFRPVAPGAGIVPWPTVYSVSCGERRSCGSTSERPTGRQRSRTVLADLGEESPMNEVTRVLSAIEGGDPHAAEQLLPLVYEELRKLAAQKLAQEKPGQTLQGTVLVHEAYVHWWARRKGSTGPCTAASPAERARCNGCRWG